MAGPANSRPLGLVSLAFYLVCYLFILKCVASVLYWFYSKNLSYVVLESKRRKKKPVSDAQDNNPRPNLKSHTHPTPANTDFRSLLYKQSKLLSRLRFLLRPPAIVFKFLPSFMGNEVPKVSKVPSDPVNFKLLQVTHPVPCHRPASNPYPIPSVRSCGYPCQDNGQAGR